jgi:GxxExxY protein
MKEQRDGQTYQILGAAMEVHRELGHGFLEAVYREALTREFAARGIPYQTEVELPVTYKGQQLRCGYRADFICFETVLVEIKALARLSTLEEAQVLNYLKATGLKRSLLINFGASSLAYKRLVFNLRESAKSADHIEL